MAVRKFALRHPIDALNKDDLRRHKRDRCEDGRRTASESPCAPMVAHEPNAEGIEGSSFERAILHSHRTVSAPRLQTSASSGAQNRHFRYTTLVGGAHPIFVVWRKERIIKLTRAMARQLLRGAMTRARLPHHSQTKTARKVSKNGRFRAESRGRPLRKLPVLSSKDSGRARESMARRHFRRKGIMWLRKSGWQLGRAPFSPGGPGGWDASPGGRGPGEAPQ